MAKFNDIVVNFDVPKCNMKLYISLGVIDLTLELTVFIQKNLSWEERNSEKWFGSEFLKWYNLSGIELNSPQ